MIKEIIKNNGAKVGLEKARKKGDKEVRRLKVCENNKVDRGELQNNEAEEREVEYLQIRFFESISKPGTKLKSLELSVRTVKKGLN